MKKVTAIGGDFFQLAQNKPPLFGVSQMGEVARHSRVGGGKKAPSVSKADNRLRAVPSRL